MVPVRRKGVPAWVLAAVAFAAAFLLFIALEARRTAIPESVEAGPSPSTGIRAVPDLYVPPAITGPMPTHIVLQPGPIAVVSPPVASQPVIVPPPPPPPVGRPPRVYGEAPPPPPQMQPRVGAGPALVQDGSAAPSVAGNSEASAQQGVPAGLAGVRSGGRMRAGTLANRSKTIAQGTIIPAVLETAFNSTHAGFARAIVSRHLRSFDGSRILVPRGSRLVGEYGGQVAADQKRAVINWTRLIRPDGVTIALNSPAVDPLGGGGLEAKVNSHLFKQLTGALFQTIFSLGSNVAAGAINRGVVVLPGGSGAPLGSSSDRIVPTLSIPAGKSISVFVAHDLEFSDQVASQ